MATSFGTRKALGRRYSVDPALILEQERLQNEYSLIPNREARATQERQFGQTMAFNAEQAALNRAERQDANEQSGTASMIGSVGNIATTAAMLRAATMAKGEPFFGGLLGGTKTAAVAPVTVDSAALAGGTAGGVGGGAATGAYTGTELGVTAGMGGAGEGAAAGGGASAGALGTAGTAAAIIAAAGLARQKWGGIGIPKEEQTFSQSFFNDPFFGTTRYGASKIFGDSNEITKVAAGGEKFIETAVAEPVNKFISGDIAGGVEGIVAGPVRAVRDAVGSVLGAVGIGGGK